MSWLVYKHISPSSISIKGYKFIKEVGGYLEAELK